MNGRPYTYSTDLLATNSAVARKVLTGEPILVYPKGTHHRANPWTGNVRTWTVDDDVVQQLVDNYTHRETRGIRQNRLPVNEVHQGIELVQPGGNPARGGGSHLHLEPQGPRGIRACLKRVSFP